MCLIRLIFQSLFLILICFTSFCYGLTEKVHFIEPGRIIHCCEKLSGNYPEIYCYSGRNKHLLHIWESVQLHVILTSDDFDHFDGSTPDEVLFKFNQHSSSWNINFYSWKKKKIRLNPFNQTCIGIVTDQNYSVELKQIRVDYWKVILLVSGLVLFFTAPKLSNNSLFYYLTGVSFGVIASFLILIFLMSKLLPRRPMMYGFLVGGWTLGVYLVQLLLENTRVIFTEYRSYLVTYGAVTGLISFVFCYRFGPVSDPRSINLIKWAMQGTALALIFCSSEFQEASLALIIILLVSYVVPVGPMFKIFQRVGTRWRGPKRVILTEDEYHQQGVVETQLGLENLRKHCSSPDCNQWKTVLRLKQPLRFAKFMEGASHLNDEEVLAFETDMKSSVDLLTDDSSSSDLSP